MPPAFGEVKGRAVPMVRALGGPSDLVGDDDLAHRLEPVATGREYDPEPPPGRDLTTLRVSDYAQADGDEQRPREHEQRRRNDQNGAMTRLARGEDRGPHGEEGEPEEAREPCAALAGGRTMGRAPVVVAPAR